MNTTKSIVALAAAFTACAAGAQTWPQFENPMVHVLIAFDGTDLTAHAEGANLDMINYGDMHTAPADVLAGQDGADAAAPVGDDDAVALEHDDNGGDA